MKILEVYKLPHTTSECERGPILLYENNNLEIQYDHEYYTNSDWVFVKFYDILSFKFTSYESSVGYMATPFGKICELTESKWIDTLIRDAQKQLYDIPNTLHHYIIYFDDKGCLEVAAYSFEIIDKK